MHRTPWPCVARSLQQRTPPYTMKLKDNRSAVRDCKLLTAIRYYRPYYTLQFPPLEAAVYILREGRHKGPDCPTPCQPTGLSILNDPPYTPSDPNAQSPQSYSTKNKQINLNLNTPYVIVLSIHTITHDRNATQHSDTQSNYTQ